MSAIAGFRSLDGGESGARDACARMLAGQQLYAPDPPAIWSEGEAALGRRLHAMLPEDAFDRGPVVDRRGRVLVADVRIDNRAELCAALGIAIETARRSADAAILSLALERWDTAALDHVVGDFAFALWDPALQRLLLARDFLGQRPLHFHRGDGFFVFASMPKGLHALPNIARVPDQHTAADFLAMRPERDGASFFAGIEKVPPGHYVVADRGGVTAHRYWRPAPKPLRLPRPDDYAEALREQLDLAVSSRLRGAEVAVATHLSAGLDSSAVAATAARLLAPTGGRVVAFTSVPREGFSGGITGGGFVDEGPLAAEIAALYPNMEHVRIRSGHRSPLDGLDRIPHLYDRPLLNLCNLTWGDAIRDDVRGRGLKVLLTGSLGNSSFSHSGMERLTELLGTGRWLRLAAEGWALFRGGTRAGTVAAQALGPFLPAAVTRAIARLRRRGHDLASYSLIDPALATGTSWRVRPWRGQGAMQLWMLQRVDYGNYVKGMLGGWGIDVRDPTADRRLVEFCLSVPVEQYLTGGVPRALARRALADRLPPAVLAQRHKGYQAADWHEGLSAARAQLSAEVEHIGRDATAASLLDLDRAQALLANWPEEGEWARADVVSAYRHALLRGVSAGHFLRKVAGTN